MLKFKSFCNSPRKSFDTLIFPKETVMKQYEWIPPKSNQKARTAVIVLFFGAFALMLIPTVIPTLPFRWVVQLLALFLLTAGIFLTTRYLTKLFIYRIVGEGASLDLTVTEASSNGKRQVTVCRVGLSGIRRLTVLDVSEPELEKKERELLKKSHTKQYDYRPDLCPAKSILLIVEEGGEELCLFLAYDERLASYLAPSED